MAHTIVSVFRFCAKVKLPMTSGIVVLTHRLSRLLCFLWLLRFLRCGCVCRFRVVSVCGCCQSLHHRRNIILLTRGYIRMGACAVYDIRLHLLGVCGVEYCSVLRLVGEHIDNRHAPLIAYFHSLCAKKRLSLHCSAA